MMTMMRGVATRQWLIDIFPSGPNILCPETIQISETYHLLIAKHLEQECGSPSLRNRGVPPFAPNSYLSRPLNLWLIPH